MPNATNDWRCFFISPIGDPDGPERMRSDDVMELLLIPSLARCGFHEEYVIRSDQQGNINIWTDMIDHLDNDELCIADITGLNTNVMFEFGYRQGSKKALIVIVEKSYFDELMKDNERPGLPFDIHNYRIIQYDLTTPKSLRDTGESLRNQIQSRIKEGFFERDGRGSITAIDAKLDVIVSRLNQALEKAAFTPGQGGQGNEEVRDLIRQAGSPISAFNYALQCRDVRLMEGLLPTLEASIPKERYIDQAVSQTAMLGSSRAAAILKSEWPYITENLSIRQQYEELGCYVSYCSRSDSEPEEFGFVLDEANRLLDVADSDDIKAGLYNQINRISFGAYLTQKRRGDVPDPQHLDTAIGALEKATELEPEEAAYYFNLATCYREKGDEEKTIESINQCLRLKSDDDDHLILAYRIYKDAGLYDEAQDARTKLKAVNPIREATLD